MRRTAQKEQNKDTGEQRVIGKPADSELKEFPTVEDRVVHRFRPDCPRLISGGDLGFGPGGFLWLSDAFQIGVVEFTALFAAFCRFRFRGMAGGQAVVILDAVGIRGADVDDRDADQGRDVGGSLGAHQAAAAHQRMAYRDPFRGIPVALGVPRQMRREACHGS
jgi:hypothetical protein